jgi:hypothetical protein
MSFFEEEHPYAPPAPVQEEKQPETDSLDSATIVDALDNLEGKWNEIQLLDISDTKTALHIGVFLGKKLGEIKSKIKLTTFSFHNYRLPI